MDSTKKNDLKHSISGKALRERHRMLRVVGGLTRFKILSLLSAHGESLNVTQIAEILDASTSTISHELIILRKNNFVDSATKGREVFYRTNGMMESLFPLLKP